MRDTRVLTAATVFLPIRKRLTIPGWARVCLTAPCKAAFVKEPGREPVRQGEVSGNVASSDTTVLCRWGARAKTARYSLVAVASLVVAGLLAGCGTTPAKDFGGRWKPVNRFAAATTEIPLYSSYVFQASPTDRTLKAMLERWATDTGLVLDYRLTSDYTLYGPVAELNTTSAQQAVSKVTSAYAMQGLSVSISGNAMTVSQAGQSPAPGDEKNVPGS